MRNGIRILVAGLLAGLCMGACDTVDDPPAPYEGERPLTFVTVTTSFAPDIQWVGGRAAAVGINRGYQAALDTSLVWLVTAPDNSLSSPLAVRTQNDAEQVRSFGGTPVDSLDDEGVYTFWIAEANAFEGGLTAAAVDSFNFVSWTDTVDFELSGVSQGDRDLNVEFSVVRDQQLTSDRYLVNWTPAVPFRQVAIRTATTGGFTDLIWHVRLPAEAEDSILPPLVIGQAPPGTEEIVAWPDEGFTPGRAHALWATTSNWTPGQFSIRATGYAYISLSSSNFP